MKYLKSMVLGLLFVFLTTSCNMNPDVAQTGGDLPRDDRYYEERKERDEDRRDVLERSRRNYSGNTCEDEDDRKHECVDQCRDMYSRRSDREDCEELPIRQIEVLAELHEILENPDDDDLRDINLEDLDVYLNVSIAAFHRLVKKYSRSEAKEVLFWMVESEEVTELFSDEDDEYEALEALFDELTSFTKATLEKPFLERIDSNDRLMEVVIEEGNEVALEWFQDYITETATGCDNEISVACFTVFCKIGNGIDDDSSEDWLSFETFEEYLEEIVADDINSGSWTDSSIEELDDVEDNWVNTLCVGLT